MKLTVFFASLVILLSACVHPIESREETYDVGSIVIEQCDDSISEEQSENTIAGYVCFAKRFVEYEQVEQTLRPIIKWKAARAGFVVVQLLSADDDIIARTVADENGLYDFQNLNLNVSSNYRLRALSQTQLNDTTNTVIGWSELPYAWSNPSFQSDLSKGIRQNIVINAANVAPAFNILSTFIIGQQFLNDVAGIVRVEDLNSVWYSGFNAYTSYCPGNANCDPANTIFVTGDVIDNDAHDDRVVLHEYGHFVLFNYSRDDSLGGAHFNHDNRQDLRLSWSEGFATAFQAMARDYAGNDRPEIYVDTNNTGLPTVFYSVEEPSGLHGLSPKGMASEVAVSAVLWDIYDGGHGESYDQVSREFNSLWDTLTALQHDRDVNFTHFNRHWQGSSLTSIYDYFSIDFSADVYEINDDYQTAQMINTDLSYQASLHTRNDDDWYKVYLNANIEYEAFTSDSINGADTVLELYRVDDVGLQFIKAHNGTSDFNDRVYVQDEKSGRILFELDSYLNFRPSDSGFYYLRVRRWGTHARDNVTSYDYIPRYGNYSLKVNTVPQAQVSS
ncbi:MAG: hypothetical protein OEY38_19980 [Gammaproteobacteria bacterium]|nr:hypothetical protein [Gammaproteobacteria bacterium]